MGLSRSIFQHTAIYSVATILGRMASFLMLPFYAHIFHAEGYGVIGMIDTTLGIFTVLLTGGFQTAILRIYHEQDESKKNLVLSTGIWLVLGISGALVVLPILLSVPLSRFVLGSSEYYPLLCLALVTFVIDITGQSASTTQIIHQQSILFSFIGLLRLFIGLGLNIWLVVILRIGLIGIFISSLVSAVVASSIFLFVAAREHGVVFDRQLAIQLLRFQLPLLPGEIISFAGRQAERILVRILVGLEGMGVLEMAYKFPPLLNLIITIPFQRAWRTKSIEIAAQEGAPQTISTMFTRYLFLMVFAGLVLAVTIQSLLEMLTPPEFWQAGRVAQIEILTTIIGGSGTYLMFGLIYSKKTKTLSIIKSVLAPFKILLGYGLITAFGLTGAAYSALIFEGVALVWLGIKSHECYKIPIQYLKIFIIFFVSFAIFIFLDGKNYKGFWLSDYIINNIDEYSYCLRQIPFFSLENKEKLVNFVFIKKDYAVSIIFNTFFCLPFLILFPFVCDNKIMK